MRPSRGGNAANAERKARTGAVKRRHPPLRNGRSTKRVASAATMTHSTAGTMICDTIGDSG